MSDSDPDGAGSPGLLQRLQRVFSKKSDAEQFAAAIESGMTGDGAALDPSRREMIERVIAFDQKRVVDVMAPRADIYAVDIETPIEELARIFSEAGHSRLPIYRGDLDDPLGMVHIKDVVGLLAGDGEKDRALKSIRREILYVPPSMLVTELLLRMQASRIHMALVIDEYGGTDGLVTIEDLVEEIVGEINDEHDEDDEHAVVPRAEGGWEVSARIELDEFEEQTGVSLTVEDEEIDTIGGYVVWLAGRVPQRGEVLTSESGFDFEIVEADARRLRKIRIRPVVAGGAKAAE